MNANLIFLDCTLRDGGYYNDWDYDPKLVQDYLQAMDVLQIDFVEIGFRSLKNHGFKGGCAYSTDAFINSLEIPSGLMDKIGVMINGSEIADPDTQMARLEVLFNPKSQSPVTLVRIACHVHEFIACLPVSTWLKEQGYLVGFNLMQVANCTPENITQLAQEASEYHIDALYFADSMGSLNPQQVADITHAFQQGWQGALGIHAHDNMGQAIANSQQAVKSGVTWVDCTVTGMGRGPGNAQTEYLILALADSRQQQGNPTKLFELIRKHFKLLKSHYNWGTNPFYYLTGRYGIHPSYVQEMLQDS
ncbi:aldolase, partial [Candidatus Falkowbacteria bacterium]|nr:aldolase [Candidatus Falkowbacteria bacterium]